MSRHIAILASLDTKRGEVELLRERIRRCGHVPVVVDTSMARVSVDDVDVPAEAVARAGGGDHEAIRASRDTDAASAVMIRGAVAVLTELLAAGRLDGIVSVGGASGTAVGTTVMKALPFGVPKLMVSSTASMPAYAAGYIGTCDIAMMHSVVDLAGVNSLTRPILERAAGAIVGMAEASSGPIRLERGERPLVALTEFKFAEGCARSVRERLAEEGYEVIAWHANGIGDRAMDELIAQGLFDAVVDLVPAGVLEELLGGNRASGPDRMEAAGRRGIPQVVTPSGFDMLSCGPLARRDGDDPLWAGRRLHDRALFLPDAFRVQARTSPEELRELAEVVARKLNQAGGPVDVLVPLGGWSELSEPGGPLHDPGADAAFLDALQPLLGPAVVLRWVDGALNSAAFAAEVVAAVTSRLPLAAAAI